MIELITNLHMHTIYSDGKGTHRDIANSAIKAGLDVVIVTDHNVLVKGVERYFQKNSHMLLLMTGEEVHNQTREPQKNHLLVIGSECEMATFARDMQKLVNEVNKKNGLTFIAHPYESALPLFNEEDISWIDWQIKGFTGIELWNGLSEIKDIIHSKFDAVFYAYFPYLIAKSPKKETLTKWDQLLNSGEKVVAVGGTDAHAHKMSMGPLKATIFPYEFHFRTINNHLLVPNKLSGELVKDKQMILKALKNGHLFVGYDLPHQTKGFRFTAQAGQSTAIMGDTIALGEEVKFTIQLPKGTQCTLIKDGQVIEEWKNKKVISYITKKTGIYRVECEINYLLKRRGWIYSNPIFVI